MASVALILAITLLESTLMLHRNVSAFQPFGPSSNQQRSSCRTRRSSLLPLKAQNHDINEVISSCNQPSRGAFLHQTFSLLLSSTAILASTSSAFSSAPALAFEGGVGGLGKTKPQTGVKFFDETSGPIQNRNGIVMAEIQSVNPKTKQPILVSFQTPWPLLTSSSGMEARDLSNPESAFVQIVPATKNWHEKKQFEQLLLDSVLASSGKFGAYGQPYNIQVKPTKKKEAYDAAATTITAAAPEDNKSATTTTTNSQLFTVTFTSLTPAMRESDRKVWIQSKQVDDTLVMLVVGTTAARFPSNEAIFVNIVDSFEAIKAPESLLR